MSSKGQTRRSHLATFFNIIRNDRACSKQSNQPPSKCQQEENEDPIILVNQVSTATLAEDTVNKENNFLSTPMFREKKKEQLTLKLNRLKDKHARYKSHKQFLEQCIQAGLIPKGLKPELEATIGNRNQEFLNNWYTKLQDFLLILMEDIVKYCDDRKKTVTLINSAEVPLKQNIEKKKTNIEEVIL